MLQEANKDRPKSFILSTREWLKQAPSRVPLSVPIRWRRIKLMPVAFYTFTAVVLASCAYPEGPQTGPANSVVIKKDTPTSDQEQSYGVLPTSSQTTEAATASPEPNKNKLDWQGLIKRIVDLKSVDPEDKQILAQETERTARQFEQRSTKIEQVSKIARQNVDEKGEPVLFGFYNHQSKWQFSKLPGNGNPLEAEKEKLEANFKSTEGFIAALHSEENLGKVNEASRRAKFGVEGIKKLWREQTAAKERYQAKEKNHGRVVISIYGDQQLPDQKAQQEYAHDEAFVKKVIAEKFPGFANLPMLIELASKRYQIAMPLEKEPEKFHHSGAIFEIIDTGDLDSNYVRIVIDVDKTDGYVGGFLRAFMHELKHVEDPLRNPVLNHRLTADQWYQALLLREQALADPTWGSITQGIESMCVFPDDFTDPNFIPPNLVPAGIDPSKVGWDARKDPVEYVIRNGWRVSRDGKLLGLFQQITGKGMNILEIGESPKTIHQFLEMAKLKLEGYVGENRGFDDELKRAQLILWGLEHYQKELASCGIVLGLKDEGIKAWQEYLSRDIPSLVLYHIALNGNSGKSEDKLMFQFDRSQLQIWEKRSHELRQLANDEQWAEGSKALLFRKYLESDSPYNLVSDYIVSALIN